MKYVVYICCRNIAVVVQIGLQRAVYIGYVVPRHDAVQRAKPTGAKGTYVQKVAISSTMGPGVKVDPASVLGA